MASFNEKAEFFLARSVGPGMVAIVLKQHLCTVTHDTAGFGEGRFWWDGGICYGFVPWIWTLLKLTLLQEGLLQKNCASLLA